ncbi:Protein FAR1-RELATED SEQUENCE 11 [Bienertia sinuspersici]
MRTTGRSEYINGFVKRFVSSKSTSKDLAKQIDVAIREIIQRQEHDNMLAVTKMNVLKANSPLENQASQVLTPFAFEKFKEECCRASQYSIMAHEGYDFMVRYYASENSIVDVTRSFGKGTLQCALASNMSSWELSTDCHKIPPIYLPRFDVILMMSHELIDGGDICCPPKSKPKGRPKNKRQESGKELTKQTSHCSKCKRAGHYANNCRLDKENDPTSTGAPKKKSKPTPLGQDLNPIYLVKY